MNKAQLIEKAVELGLDASGTKAALKERIEAYNALPKPVVSERIEGNPARHKYRHGVHLPKGV